MVLPYDWAASYLGNDIRKRMGAVFGDEGVKIRRLSWRLLKKYPLAQRFQ